LPGGRRLAIELQRGEMSDAEWIARHQDYARAGITDLWLWHPDTRVPLVVFRHGQPGWRFDLETRKIGLIYARPGRAAAGSTPQHARCRAVHWPPCPADELAVTWMPLGSARLTMLGIEPSTETVGELERLAAVADRELAVAREGRATATRGREQQDDAARPPVIWRTDVARDKFQRTHEAFRWDAFPPWTDPDIWCYGCYDMCGLELTGAMLKASAIVHVVRAMEQASTGRPREIELRYGGVPAGTKSACAYDG
jgi:hypothetical protein